MATCWERANHFALLYVVFYGVFVTSECGILCQVWFWIVSLPVLCLLSYPLNEGLDGGGGSGIHYSLKN